MGRFMDYGPNDRPMLVDLYQCMACKDMIRVPVNENRKPVCHKCIGEGTG
jgi:hypothetical protein